MAAPRLGRLGPVWTGLPLRGRVAGGEPGLTGLLDL